MALARSIECRLKDEDDDKLKAVVSSCKPVHLSCNFNANSSMSLAFNNELMMFEGGKRAVMVRKRVSAVMKVSLERDMSC